MNEMMLRNGKYNSNPTIFDLFARPLADFDFLSRDEKVSFKVDVKDDGDAYELIADMPGTKKEDLKISCENGYLTIEALHHKDSEKDESGFIIKERRNGSYMRSFNFEDADYERTEAKFSDGVLNVKVYKKQKEASKFIEIQ